MSWNWELPDWPRFTWDAAKLTRAEGLFRESAGMVVGAVRHLPDADRDALTVELLTGDAIDTSAIEGERLDRDRVQSSIRKQMGLSSDPRRVKPGEAGIAEMLVDIFRTYDQPLTRQRLCAWHRMVVRGRSDLEAVGRYRTHAEPMRVISGYNERQRLHFEAPPSSRMRREMARFLEWFGYTAPDGGGRLPALTRAGLSHLWFESVHPFEDGNGRIGRAIAEKALMQGLGRPAVTALSSTMLLYRKDYYQALERASRGLDATDWLLWFSTAAIEAGRRGFARVEFLIHKSRMLDALRGRINPRQEKALLRMFEAGPDGFAGGMSAGKYAAITGAPPATVTRDLADLVAKGALIREGERKATRYRLNLLPGAVAKVRIADIL